MLDQMHVAARSPQRARLRKAAWSRVSRGAFAGAGAAFAGAGGVLAGAGGVSAGPTAVGCGSSSDDVSEIVITSLRRLRLLPDPTGGDSNCNHGRYHRITALDRYACVCAGVRGRMTRLINKCVGIRMYKAACNLGSAV